MIAGRRVVAVVPARAGSKSVRGKNIKSLGGKPLVAWSIETARQVTEIDRVIVSTDGAEIAHVARSCGAEVYDRPARLATDTARVADALRDLARRLAKQGEKAAYMVLLEPTAPFRVPDDVRACLKLLAGKKLDSVATFTEAALNPQRAWRIVRGKPAPFLKGADPWRPRQKLQAAFQLNGAVYAFSIEKFMKGPGACGTSLLFGKTGAVIMPPERSLDIDAQADFAIAEAMLAAR